MTMKGATARTISNERPLSEPAFHWRIWSKAVGLSKVMPDEMPPSTEPMATPASVSRMGVAPPRPIDREGARRVRDSGGSAS